MFWNGAGRRQSSVIDLPPRGQHRYHAKHSLGLSEAAGFQPLASSLPSMTRRWLSCGRSDGMRTELRIRQRSCDAWAEMRLGKAHAWTKVMNTPGTLRALVYAPVPGRLSRMSSTMTFSLRRSAWSSSTMRCCWARIRSWKCCLIFSTRACSSKTCCVPRS